MKCPNCGVESPEGTEDCPACGLIFAKWQKKTEAAQSPAEENYTTPSSSSGNLRPYLTGFIGLALALGGAAYYFSKPHAAPAAGAAAAGLISPEPYRGEIAAIETALYKDEAANYQDAAAVENAARKIAERMMLSPALRRHAGLEKISMLAAMTGEGGLTYTSTARREWATSWEQARDGLFEKAAWFHAPLFYNPAAAAAADPNKGFTDLARAMAGIERLIAEARRETQGFGRNNVNLQNLKAAPGNEAELEQWRAWVQQWQARVSQVRGDMPDPQLLTENVREAHTAMTQVLDHLASPANPGPGAFLEMSDPAFNAVYLPGESLRANWLTTAENWLRYPRAVLANPNPKPRDL